MSEKSGNNKKFEKEEFESVPKEEVRGVKVVQPYQKVTRRGGFNFGNLFLGMLIIFVGIIFLGRTTGWFYILEILISFNTSFIISGIFSFNSFDNCIPISMVFGCIAKMMVFNFFPKIFAISTTSNIPIW